VDALPLDNLDDNIRLRKRSFFRTGPMLKRYMAILLIKANKLQTEMDRADIDRLRDGFPELTGARITLRLLVPPGA